MCSYIFLCIKIFCWNIIYISYYLNGFINIFLLFQLFYKINKLCMLFKYRFMILNCFFSNKFLLRLQHKLKFTLIGLKVYFNWIIGFMSSFLTIPECKIYKGHIIEDKLFSNFHLWYYICHQSVVFLVHLHVWRLFGV